MSDINEIVSKKAIQGIITTDESITRLDKSTMAYIITIEKLAETLRKEGITLKELNAAQKRANEEKERSKKQDKELTAAEKALEKQRQRGLAQMAKMEAKEMALQAAIQKEVKSEQDLIAKTNALVAVRRRLDTTTKAGIAEHKRLTAEINRNTKSLLAQDKQIRRNQRNVGNYGSALKGVAGNLMGALGITAGLAGMVRVLRGATRTLIDFDKAMAKVKAVTGATGKEFQKLSKDAKRLGAITQFTASEVAGLQLEFAKIGFSTAEILNATEATLQLATATGSDLSQAAEIAGSTIRAFGMDASETQRVVDVMALSFSSSALDLNRFGESMKYVAPIAKSLGITIEQATAHLSALADAGIHGSMAGTSLRKVYQEMANTGLDADQAFAKLTRSGISVVDAFDEVGARAQTALLILSENKDKVDELSGAYDNAAGSAQKMAAIVEDTTAGSIKKLSSAWDGLILSFSSSGGVIKTIVDGLANFVTNLTMARKSLQELQESVQLTQDQENVKAAQDQIRTMAESLVKNGMDLVAAQQQAYELYREQTQQSILNATDRQEVEILDGKKEKLRQRVTSLTNELSAIDEIYKKASDQRKEVAKKQAEKDAEAEAKIRIDATKKVIKEVAKILADKEDIEVDDSFIDDQVEHEISVNESKLKTLLEQDEEYYAELNKHRKKDAEDAEMVAIQISELKKQLLDESIAAGFDIFQSSLERESMALEEKRQNELINAADDKEAQAKINAKYDKQQAAIKTKQAKADKAQALISIAINTARAIVSSIAQTPLPAGLPLVLLNAALGAIQHAAVAARPIPKFFKGTESAPAGVISVAEKGSEIAEKGGKSILFNKPTITSGLEGARIYTNQETQRILNDRTSPQSGSDPAMISELIQTNKMVASALSKQTHNHFYPTHYVKRSGNYTENYRNKKLKGLN